MTFYLVGLGLDLESISLEAKKSLESCDEIYLESYTVDFPYGLKELEKSIGKKFDVLKREKTEDESILKEAKKSDIALLIYGDPFSATTHTQLILSCKKKKIPFKIYHNASIINSIGETGLSLYKFGKISSMPTWTDKYKPSSFMDYIKENQSIRAHSLLLVDIGLDFSSAVKQLSEASREKNINLDKILVVSSIGTEKKKFFYENLKNLKDLRDVQKPFCFIIPSEMHFLEKEALELL